MYYANFMKDIFSLKKPCSYSFCSNQSVK